MDDVLSIIKKHAITNFHNLLNSIDPHINFTINFTKSEGKQKEKDRVFDALRGNGHKGERDVSDRSREETRKGNRICARA